MSRSGPGSTDGAAPRIALLPDWPEAADAVRSAGGQVVPVEEAEGLAGVLDAAEDIVNAAGPAIVAEAEKRRDDPGPWWKRFKRRP